MITINQKEISDFSKSSKLEWIETNGVGGYASSTIIGLNSRRYHGLLVSANNPPVEKEVIVSKLDEAIVLKNKFYELSVNQFPGNVSPKGYQYLVEFKKDLFPEFIYKVDSVKIKKTIAAISERNTTVIIYEVLEAIEEFEIQLTPFIAMRDFHSLRKADVNLQAEYSFKNNLLKFNLQNRPTTLFASINKGEFTSCPDWYYNFEYLEELNRGLDYREDLFKPGFFKTSVNKGDKIIVTLSSIPILRDGLYLFEKEKYRREKIVADSKNNTILKQLLLAADQFIVKRKESGKTIIAGYHWFSDWGRDTMISLPGLTLSTKRFNDAQSILETFAAAVDKGMIPNRFPDYGESPEYNTVDASLWFIIAIKKYLDASNDFYFVRETLYPIVKNIISWHEKGTRHNIYEDYDGLLYSGEPGVQLTWMDAKIGDWVVTPRQGKAVEINALWYNVLHIAAYLSNVFNKKTCEAYYKKKANKVFKNFNETFWNEEGGYLFDYVDDDYKDSSFRPNQIYAISLPYKLLGSEKAKLIVDKVYENLYTPFGLRSLSPNNENYKPIYTGDQYLRDSAYHQGTVWSFLLGAFADAIEFAYPKENEVRIKKIIENFILHISNAGLGTVSEIFDGNFPHNSKGCIAQAWGVAEFLRIYQKYGSAK
ncbi:MAG: glycogen debranching protein [Ignavibacteriales bacterium CG18_big_fil_WC_8_21_14_2_50_31_20]|nr:MAG: glycogen debranching protein [Ignavibacteriales bacterium CG18_big_fil_WC_8_21_14_2_50_31_20]